MRTTVRARLRLNNTAKLSLWYLREQQREFSNLGVETALFFHKAGRPIPSDYAAHTSVLSPVRKDKTHRWSRQNLSLQRGGLAAGLEAVRKWSKHKGNLDNNLDYWTGRAEKYPDDPKVLRKRSVAEQKLSKHREAGTKRLFRRRREEEACSGAALVYGESARLVATERGYTIRLPGGLVPSLREKGFALPEGHSFTGAVQVVDITDIKGGVTRRTLPEHRTYNIHLSCTMKAPPPKEVENEFDVLGVDLGIDHPAYRSDGISHSMPNEKEMQKDIKATQRRRARCQEGSRRWRKRNREVAALSRKKSNRRQNNRNHNAKAIATSGHVMVSVEDLQAKNMSSTAKGTMEHPGTRVAQKRGLNRSLQRVGVRATLDAIERACQKNGTGFLGVPPYYTSQTCSLCGEIGKREKQAFTCTSCGVVSQSDFNAARNLRKAAYLIIRAAAKQGRRKTRSHNPDRGCGTNKRLATRQPPYKVLAMLSVASPTVSDGVAIATEWLGNLESEVGYEWERYTPTARICDPRGLPRRAPPPSLREETRQQVAISGLRLPPGLLLGEMARAPKALPDAGTIGLGCNEPRRAPNLRPSGLGELFPENAHQFPGNHILDALSDPSPQHSDRLLAVPGRSPGVLQAPGALHHIAHPMGGGQILNPAVSSRRPRNNVVQVPFSRSQRQEAQVAHVVLRFGNADALSFPTSFPLRPLVVVLGAILRPVGRHLSVAIRVVTRNGAMSLASADRKPVAPTLAGPLYRALADALSHCLVGGYSDSAYSMRSIAYRESFRQTGRTARHVAIFVFCVDQRKAHSPSGL